jgi:hypothetical protein
MFCPVMQAPLRNLYLYALYCFPKLLSRTHCTSDPRLHPCGHTFSENALHGVLQEAVLAKFQRMKLLYPYKFEGDPARGSPTFPEDVMREYRKQSSRFKPEYKCPLCNIAITHYPVKCRILCELGEGIHKLTSPLVERLEYLEDLKGTERLDTFPNLPTYFIFFKPHFVA